MQTSAGSTDRAQRWDRGQLPILGDITRASTNQHRHVMLIRSEPMECGDCGDTEDLLEIIMRPYERFSTLLTSNRPVEDWGKLLGDVAALSAMLDRLLHHGHVLKCGPRSWRTKASAQA